MHRRWLVFLFAALALPCGAQPRTRQNLAVILGFENGQPGVFPAGWGGSPADTIFVDDKVVHSGKYAARIERGASSSGTVSTLSTAIPVDVAGKTIEWRGFIKTDQVNGFVALWLREDGHCGNIAFNSLQGLQLKGTRDWTEYSITVPVMPEGRQLVFGFLLSGTGTAWVDDLRLLVDGKPVADAPDRFTDNEYDNGSRITITDLSDIQIKNLATLAKVWGFLKYHHPAVTVGARQWDYDLFRILPAVLAAADSEAANKAVSGWIASLGAVAKCTDCARLDSRDLYLNTNIDWIADESLLGADLSQTLLAIHRNRTPAVRQFFISLAPDVGNPVFENESLYQCLRLPDAGYQLLGLFRFWNMVQYFFPYRDVMADDPANSPDYWNKVLEESIPGFALAKDRTYEQELTRLIARINDTHAQLSANWLPPMGGCPLPVEVRFVEGKPLIIRHTSATAGPASGLMPGDLIEQLDGVAVDDLLTQWHPFYSASNEAARLLVVANYMSRGSCGAATVQVRRGDQSLTVQTNRVRNVSLDLTPHDRPGPTFQRLSNDVAYLRLRDAQATSAASYVQSAAGTKGLILDLRNYPSDFPLLSAFGSRLVSGPKDFARVTVGDVVNPGAFHWDQTVTLTPQPPRYTGKVVILVDEVTISRAEWFAMAFRTAPGAIVIGSTTAGADGNISPLPLPGGGRPVFSGIGVFYPDKRPTQRIGIVPDIVVKPTIAGILAGRDELVEAAIRQITGN